MSEVLMQDDDEVSLFAVGTTLLRNRWRIALLMFLGLVFAVVPVIRQPLEYSATAAFVPNGASDATRSGLASLAGQFGVTVPTSGQTQSPEFYTRLLKSRELLAPITRDTFVVAEMNGKRVPFSELFGISGNAEVRQEAGVETLQLIIGTDIQKLTGIIDLSAHTQWRSVSLAIVAALVSGVNDFNQKARQGQAASERKFVETRLDLARSDLRGAEDRLEEFLKSNRVAGSPNLTFQQERLQREVSMRQQVYTALAQSYEDARIREVRDTPLITVIESPNVPTRPEPRGRSRRALIGMLLGGLVGVIWALLAGMMASHREAGDPKADEFVSTVKEAKDELLHGIRVKRRAG